MTLSDPLTAAVLIAALGLLAVLLRWRRQSVARRPDEDREALDTVQDWPPAAVRVLSVAERRAYDLLRTALPGFLVLAQVPLARFLRVPSRHSHSEWMQRVGYLSADLLVCSAGSRVLAVVDIRPVQQTERSRKRHERMARVLRAAGIAVHVWSESRLPSVAEVRAQLGAELMRASESHGAQQQRGAASKPVPIIPVAEIEEMLAEGDAAASDATMEPVPSAFFDDMESRPRQAAAT